MTTMKTIVAYLGLLLLASSAAAESRTVLVVVKQNQEKSPSISIYSDVKSDRRAAVSLDQAIQAIGQLKGWGSLIGVYVVADPGFTSTDRNKLFAAIDTNGWARLEYFGREVPKLQQQYFLDRAGPAAAEANHPVAAERPPAPSIHDAIRLAESYAKQKSISTVGQHISSAIYHSENEHPHWAVRWESDRKVKGGWFVLHVYPDKRIDAKYGE